MKKLEFLQFLAELLSNEERNSVLTHEQESTLRRRRAEVESGKVKMVPAEQVKAKLAAKYGLQT